MKNSNIENENFENSAISVLFEINAPHILQNVFLRLSPDDLDRCKLVCKSWNAFLRENIWYCPLAWKIVKPKWEFELERRWNEYQPRVVKRYQLTETQAYYRFVFDPRGRPQIGLVVITIFTQVVRPSVHPSQFFKMERKLRGLHCGLAEWIIDDSYLVFTILSRTST